MLHDTCDLEEEYDWVVEVYRDSARDVIGKTKKQSKQWIKEGTWKRVEERNVIKEKLESAKYDRLKERLNMDYIAKDREVKRSAREGKRKWTEGKSEAVEKDSEKGRSKEVDADWWKAETDSGGERQTGCA